MIVADDGWQPLESRLQATVQMLLSVEDLPALLSRAASRQGADGVGGRLLVEFVEEVVQSAGSESIRLIEVTRMASRLICFAGSQTAIGLHEGATVQQKTEQQRRLESVIQQIQTDQRMSLARIVGDGEQSFAVAEVASGIVLLIEYIGSSGGTALLDGIAEICADLHRRESLSELRQLADRRHQVDPFLATLYAARDEYSLSNILATDGAALLGCHRVAVCQRTASGTWRLVASTAVPQPNHRADAVRDICRMISDAEQAGARVSLDRPNGIDLSSQQHWICPLSPDGVWDGAEFAVLFEWSPRQIPDRASLAVVRMHAAQALQSVGSTSGSAWKTVSRWVSGSHRSRFVSVAASLMAGLAFLLFWPMELTIEGNGVLEPSQRKYLWAADEGIVTEVAVVDGQEVEANTKLIRIRNEELQLQLETILGDLATSRARLAAIEGLRVGRESSRDPQLLSEHSEVTARIQSLEEQSRLLEQRIQSLTVTSPLKGRLFGTSLRERFLGRPVVRGQYFGEVADLTATWEIRLQVKEADVRHLLDAVIAEGNTRTYPEVTFALATQPEVFSTIRITSISPTTRLDSYGNLTTEVIASVTELPTGVNRPGTGVLGRIHCGKRSAGYVCFRRMIDYMNRTIFM